MATNWLDRVPTYPGRWKITKEDGSYEYVTMERADEPTVEGTPVNAANMNALETTVAAAKSTADKAMPKTGGEFTDTVSTTKFFHFKIDNEHYMMIGKSNNEFAISMYNNGTWVETLRVNADGTIKSGQLMPKSGGDLTDWLKYSSYDNMTKTDASVVRQTYVKNAAGTNVATFQIRMDRK